MQYSKHKFQRHSIMPKFIDSISSKLWNFWEGKAMDYIFSPLMLGVFEMGAFGDIFIKSTRVEKFFMIFTAILPLIAISRLKGIMKATNRKNQLAKDLIAFREKHGAYYQFGFSPGCPVYDELLFIMKESNVIPPFDIYLFEKGSFMPATPTIGTPSPPNFRLIMLEQIIDWAIFHTKY